MIPIYHLQGINRPFIDPSKINININIPPPSSSSTTPTKCLLIDSSSSSFRIGSSYDSSSSSLIEFDPIVGKCKRKLYIGNNFYHMTSGRESIKTPYSKDVIYNVKILENIFDYIFGTLLKITNDTIDYSIMMTEPLWTPRFSRSMISELLFETYEVPKILYGIDSLYGYYEHCKRTGIQIMNKGDGGDDGYGLVIKSGMHNSYVIPIVKGEVDLNKCKKIAIGGSHITSFLMKLLHNKYPQFVPNQLSHEKIEEIKLKTMYVSENYIEEVRRFSSDGKYFNEKTMSIQFPYKRERIVTQNEINEKENKKKIRREKSQIVLKERNEARYKKEEEDLRIFNTIIDLKNTNNTMYLKELNRIGFSEKQLIESRDFLVKKRDKKRKRDESKIIKKKKEEFERPKKKVKRDKYEELKLENPEKWLKKMKKKRKKLEEKVKKSDERKGGRRKRRAAGHKRLRKLTSAIKGDDENFGRIDSDWNVYHEMNELSEVVSDIENDKIKLSKMEMEIAQIEMQLYNKSSTHVKMNHYVKQYQMLLAYSNPWRTQELFAKINEEERYQIQLTVERIRAPELLFCPYFVGSRICGLDEAINMVLKSYNVEDQIKMAKNIYLSGGNLCFKGMKKRIENELQKLLPCNSIINVYNQHDHLDPWNGMKSFLNDNSNSNDYFITKQDYLEYGNDYVKEYMLGNKYNFKLL